MSGKEREMLTHINAPEFFDRIKGNDLLEEVVPVVAL
jgi:hypothetical protein